MTKSMHVALKDLNLNRLYVIYPGEKSWPLHEKVQALPLSQIDDEIVAHGKTPSAKE